jgi:hypothetical protein
MMDGLKYKNKRNMYFEILINEIYQISDDLHKFYLINCLYNKEIK